MVLLFLISFLVLADFKAGLLAAFVLGLVRDLWEARVLGESSLKFLILALIVNLYKRKFRAESFFYLLPFTFLVLLAWQIGLIGRIGHIGPILKESLLGSLLIVPVFFIFSRVWYKIVRKEGKIRV